MVLPLFAFDTLPDRNAGKASRTSEIGIGYR